MSTEWKSRTSATEIVEFLAEEYAANTGIPVHAFNVVNATFTSYNRMLGVTDGVGTLFFEDEHRFKGYGTNNPLPMIRVLNQCNVGIR